MVRSLSSALNLRGLLKPARRRNPFRNAASAAVAGIIVSVIVLGVLNTRR